MEELSKTNKIYRYESLLQAIDFFTQRFGLEELESYAFDFSNEILTLNSAALFVRQSNDFVQKNSKLYANEKYIIPNNGALEHLPVFHGDIITSNFEDFFSEKDIQKFEMKIIIPLIIHDFLYGFIISNGKILGSLDEDDLSIAHALIRLFGNSLECNSHVHELDEKNKQLDQKVFKLFAINQSAKSLLSEVDLNALYSLATDVFSEITCSRVTSFGVYDSISKSIKVLGYRNVSTYATFYTELYLVKREYGSNRIVLDMEKDKEIIESIFQNWEEFERLQAKYIVLLVKDEILGVVTLSESVNGSLYDEDTFELVETLASFTHIAISNALLFKEIVAQKERVERKFDILNTLNKITRNINRSTNIEEISTLTLKVLSLNFGIKKAFFAYCSQECYTVKHVIGLDNRERQFVINDNWEKALQGEMVLDFREDAMGDFFDNTMVEGIGFSNCIVVSPIFIETSAYDEQSSPIGFLVVLETKDSLKEEEIVLIDTITKNISPVIYQMDLNHHILQEYKPDPLQKFIQVANTKLLERKEFELNFYLYYKILDRNPFKKEESILMQGQETYIVDSIMFVFTYDIMEDALFYQLPDFERVEELFDFEY